MSDDVLSEMFAQLSFGEIEVDDLSGLDLLELSDLLEDYDRQLAAMGELQAGRSGGSPEARELHSRRGAVMIEMRKRGY